MTIQLDVTIFYIFNRVSVCLYKDFNISSIWQHATKSHC